jgi:hypothetical protein
MKYFIIVNSLEDEMKEKHLYMKIKFFLDNYCQSFSHQIESLIFIILKPLKGAFIIKTLSLLIIKKVALDKNNLHDFKF